ncbi:ABC transporter permease subunit [Cellulomonas humilata]|uniref:ABC transporter permease subunit n=1 Tax=Cellulomonas humilata TaxID=144055 RepID=A0A7Y6A176_9CELL|nr:ABC transporter permease subunit [Cellulomonas humilata]NUU17780.1 ABC transporter permease subunit [Cellulomonas humilata]
MTSISAAEGTATLARGAVRPLAVVAFWVVVWQVSALVVGHEVLLASPAKVVARLGELSLTADFWATVWTSFARIAGGFVAASVLGVLGAALAATSRVVDALVTPALAAVRSTPVVSFIILVLIWVSSDQLALVISFLMVLPIIYTNVLEGIRHRDRALLEVADVFGVPRLRRLPAVDLPAVLPFFTAACRTGVGLAWKSGIAAEVIGLAEGSIGERLYEAKILLSSADLFAWTAVIIAVSFGVEKLLVTVLRRTERRLA